MKLFEMFSGFGGASFALKKAGIEFETVGYSEIDKFAHQCYQQNHDNTFMVDCGEFGMMPGAMPIYNFGDATKINVDDLPDFDLLTGGTPCQDFSIAGKGKGAFNEDGTLTRSGLLFDYVRILKAKKPKYLLWENVKGILSKKHRDLFIMFLKMLSDSGYDVDFKLFNSKDYGIPQNRERVFVYGVRR